MFLATQNKIRDTLKETLQSIPSFEDLLCDVINLCAYMFENKMFLLPNEKHMLVKVNGIFYLMKFYFNLHVMVDKLSIQLFIRELILCFVQI
jgi:cytoplasmic FMR1 interacting protein